MKQLLSFQLFFAIALLAATLNNQSIFAGDLSYIQVAITHAPTSLTSGNEVVCVLSHTNTRVVTGQALIAYVKETSLSELKFETGDIQLGVRKRFGFKPNQIYYYSGLINDKRPLSDIIEEYKTTDFYVIPKDYC